jgi:hypothetical protein
MAGLTRPRQEWRLHRWERCSHGAQSPHHDGIGTCGNGDVGSGGKGTVGVVANHYPAKPAVELPLTSQNSVRAPHYQPTSGGANHYQPTSGGANHYPAEQAVSNITLQTTADGSGTGLVKPRWEWCLRPLEWVTAYTHDGKGSWDGK